MSFVELIRVDCDGCGFALGGPHVALTFRSHTEALRRAEHNGWYVDSQVVLCPGCFGFALEWFERWTTGLTCCVCGVQIPWHYAVINCGSMGVACLSHEGELRGWGHNG